MGRHPRYLLAITALYVWLLCHPASPLPDVAS
jgi:hypothetical protein